MNPPEAIGRVAEALTALGLSDVVFVGGAVVGLLLTDPAAPPPRATDDVDVVMGEASRAGYHRFEARLREAGYSQPMEGPICRWRIAGVNVDLMPINAEVLGFTNRWYGAMMAHALVVKLNERRSVRIVSAPYLIATKLVAFRDRGAGDVLFSRDLGDIIALVDGREEVVNEVLATESEARAFIADAFRWLVADPSFLEAVPAHLLPDAASQARAPIVIERVRRIAGASPTGTSDS